MDLVPKSFCGYLAEVYGLNLSSGISSPAAEGHQGPGAHSGQDMDALQAQLLEAFREQMEMCHSLMELENANTELHVDTCRHLLTIAE